MDPSRLIKVTLSNDLLEHLRREAMELRVPLRWLVAGIICDTIESGTQAVSNREQLIAAH